MPWGWFRVEGAVLLNVREGWISPEEPCGVLTSPLPSGIAGVPPSKRQEVLVGIEFHLLWLVECRYLLIVRELVEISFGSLHDFERESAGDPHDSGGAGIGHSQRPKAPLYGRRVGFEVDGSLGDDGGHRRQGIDIH